jgi:hypothetical protein
MRPWAIAAVLLTTVACSSGSAAAGDPEQAAKIYKAVIRQGYDRPGRTLIVQEICADADQIVPDSCTPMGEDVHATLERELGDGYRFIPNPRDGGNVDDALRDATLIRWLGPVSDVDGAATVKTSYFCGPVCTEGGTDTLELRNGNWTVTDSRWSWIS